MQYVLNFTSWWLEPNGGGLADGWEVLDALTTENLSVPTVVLTAHTLDAGERETILKAARDIAHKPVPGSVLYDLIFKYAQ